MRLALLLLALALPALPEQTMRGRFPGPFRVMTQTRRMQQIGGEYGTVGDAIRACQILKRDRGRDWDCVVLNAANRLVFRTREPRGKK